MKKVKQILAWIGIVLLVAMYGSTLVFALIGNDWAMMMLRASVACTIVVPVILYAVSLAGRAFGPEPEDKENPKEH